MWKPWLGFSVGLWLILTCGRKYGSVAYARRLAFRGKGQPERRLTCIGKWLACHDRLFDRLEILAEGNITEE
jgi:hypothetical protein